MLKLKDIVELGIRPDHSSYLKRKIKLSNQISFIFVSYLFILNIIFLALNLTNYLYLGVIVGLLYVIPLVLSYFNSPRVGRFIISILPSIGILSSHAAILGNEEEPVTSILILQFSVIVMPWILFNVREKIALPASLMITSAMFFLFPVVNPLLDFNFDSAVIREPFFDVFIKLSSCIILFIILYILQQDSMESEQNNLLLIKEMKEQQNLLHANEYKLNEYIKEIEKAKEEDKIRQWRADGIARFNEMIRRNNQDTQKLYDEIIAEMVKHNGANQGGLFILNESGEDEPFLEMS
ncbi:MAG: hypothetical protein MUE81_21755, partial [Thermoflexibacter sp.]|nr:hypothetical protein [Thermoflexibacter sp.]